ncbi:MAG: Ku protein [Acidobacteria bacterium]|nr:Ku protein [Acidobacteriota bacterium]
MAATVWKGHLTFGLISIPIGLYSAARGERVSFHYLHGECNSRIRQQYFCPVCNRAVERDELVRGYEYEKEQYVLIDEEEIKQVTPASGRAMEILEFVEQGEVDPIYFDASYYLVPEDAGRKAYYLLLRTIEKSGYVAIAKLVMHQREYTVILRPHDHGLMLHTMYYANEIRRLAEYGKPDGISLKDQEVKLAEQLIESLVAKFEPEKYRDEFTENVKQLIEAKIRGQEVTAAPQPQLAPVIDLMEALKKSLAQQKAAPKKAPARAPVTAQEKVRRKAAQ